MQDINVSPTKPEAAAIVKGSIYLPHTASVKVINASPKKSEAASVAKQKPGGSSIVKDKDPPKQNSVIQLQESKLP